MGAALLAVVAADGPPAYGAPPAYHPAPAYKPVEKLPPQPYAYEYGVADDYSKANFKKTETQDAEGKVAGSFTIALPDGRMQTTTTDSLLRSLMKVPLSTPQSPPLDTDTLLLLTQPVIKFVDRTYTPFLNVKD